MIVYHGTARSAAAFATRHGLDKDSLIALYGPAEEAIAALDSGLHTLVVRPKSSLVEPGPGEEPRMTPEVDEALHRALLRVGRASREWDGTPEDLQSALDESEKS